MSVIGGFQRECAQSNPVLNAAIMKVVDHQLVSNSNDPKRLIACVVAAEVFDILKQQQTFNLERFIKALDKLPAMSWDEAESESRPSAFSIRQRQTWRMG